MRIAAAAAAAVWPAAAAPDAAATVPARPSVVVAPAAGSPAGDRITLNVEEGDIQQVLTAFSRQTGRNIVIGPDVRGQVTVRVSDVSWQTALDVILRPYGFSYQVLEDAVIVTKFDPKAVVAPAVQEPLVVKVFTLKYLDASDMEEIVRVQISPQGSVTVLRPLGQFWEPESGGGDGGIAGKSGADTTLSRGRRTQEVKTIVRSKRFVVRDTEAVIRVIGDLVDQLDIQPQQVLIEARFVEMGSDLARDIGLEFNGGATFRNGEQVQRIGGESASLQTRPRIMASDAPYATVRPFDTGGTLLFQQLTDVQFSVLMHMMEDAGTANVLSSPRILTLNNQEARIIVGEKFPIITVSATPSTSGPEKTTTLDYYEKIGIQLAVVPQICASNRISMIVRPSVTDRTSLVETYPVLSTREAETQIMVVSGETVVIGGLVRDRERQEQFRVPFFGSIPLLGWLFKREATIKDKVDLLIFLTATIHSQEMEAASGATPR